MNRNGHLLTRLGRALGAGARAVSGEATRFGVRGPFDVWAGDGGRFSLRFGGELGESAGSDGRRSWGVDWTGMPRPLELADLEIAQLLSCALTGGWMLPGSPFSLEERAGTEPVLAVRHRRGRLSADLELARDTSLPVSLRFASPLGVETLHFGDYLETDGAWIPGRVEAHSGGGVSAVYEARAADLVGSNGEPFAPPSPPDDVRFALDASPDVMIRRGTTGHVLARVSLGDEVGWFVVDTGAGGATALDAGTAARLDLPALGSSAIGSVDGVARVPVLRGPPLTIGPLTLERPILVALDLDFLQGIFDEPIVGLIGWDLFSRCVAELSLAQERLSLHDPERYVPPGGAVWRELVVHTRHPVVRARYENARYGLFRLDVGAAGGALANVVFHAPTVERERLLDDRDYEGVRVGQYEVALGPMLWFQLEAHRFERPVVAFARDHSGPFADPYVDGNLGVGFLSPFTLVLDYRRKRIAFVPNETAAP